MTYEKDGSEITASIMPELKKSLQKRQETQRRKRRKRLRSERSEALQSATMRRP